jgi:hypothetical protein
MPYENDTPIDGQGGGTPYMEMDATGTYVGHNEELVYSDPDWQDPNAHLYVEDGTAPMMASGSMAESSDVGAADGGERLAASGGGAKLTVTSRNGGYVTVRSNSTITFNGSIPFGGRVSGSIPAGATFRGRDSNGNGIPDLLEREIKGGRVKFVD